MLFRSLGSFNKIIGGVKNIQKIKKLKVYVHSLLLKQNISELSELEKHIKERLKLSFVILPVRPKDSLYKYNDLKVETGNILDANLNSTSLMGFPVCLLNGTSAQLTRDGSAISSAMKYYLLSQKFIKTKECKKCPEEKKCLGKF